MIDPCQTCGGPVRIKEHTVSTLGGDSVVEQRICLNNACETNERPRTLGTPVP